MAQVSSLSTPGSERELAEWRQGGRGARMRLLDAFRDHAVDHLCALGTQWKRRPRRIEKVLPDRVVAPSKGRYQN